MLDVFIPDKLGDISCKLFLPNRHINLKQTLMNRYDLQERHHNVMDVTLNSLQQLFLLTQQMMQQVNDGDCPLEMHQQLLESLNQIEAIGITIRSELLSFSGAMEAFLMPLDTEGADPD